MPTDFEQSIKSKERVKNNGEVFTPKKIVVDMCDLPRLKEETYRLDSKILEPACGTGNFLVELIDRKMKTVDETTDTEDAYSLNMIKAITTIYGIDISWDNIVESRQRMKEVALQHYKDKFGKDMDNRKVAKAMDFVLGTNIILGDTLKGIMHRDYKGGFYELQDGQEDALMFTEYVFDGDTVTMNECPIDNLSENAITYKPINYLRMHKRELVIQEGGIFGLDATGEFEL